MPLDLIFEIGTEEIPAGFLARGMSALEERAKAKLEAARLVPASLRVLGTPRRLALCVAGLPDRQPDISEEVVGPPAQAAFDKEGKPTQAALGFAKKNGADPNALRRGEVPGKKGEYVLCTRLEKGRAAREVLPALLTELCAELPWPKSMRWGFGQTAFARPVHWLVALLGKETLPVAFAGITAGTQSRGHRFLAPGPVELDGSLEGYTSALRKAHVIVDPADRRRMIEAELSRVEKEQDVKIRPDGDLLDEVTNLVEYPVAVSGAFDARFLEVPEQVIVSAMRAHQKYFATEKSGKLAPSFVTIAGMITKDPKLVRAGNERVLAARLNDAKFFFQEDQKKKLEEWNERLKGVVFQAKLGTVHQKMERIKALATFIASRVGVDEKPTARAASLCKADLVSHMVGEFPDLQGVMGYHYALASGEDKTVARAIMEHYQPKSAGGQLPESAPGAVLALADRFDTLVGCFAAGLQPTGSADPYGLRRAALGILAILIARNWTPALSELVAQAKQPIPVTPQCLGDVKEFLRIRLRGLAEGQGLPVDCVDAALAAGFDNVPDALARAQVLAQWSRRQDFAPLATAFKRVANILKGATGDRAPDPKVFTEEDERTLWTFFTKIEKQVGTHLEGKNYNGALEVLATLKEPVDRFFDKVLVMDKDERVRENRMAMLSRINATFNRIADFRQLAAGT